MNNLDTRENLKKISFWDTVASWASIFLSLFGLGTAIIGPLTERIIGVTCLVAAVASFVMHCIMTKRFKAEFTEELKRVVKSSFEYCNLLHSEFTGKFTVKTMDKGLQYYVELNDQLDDFGKSHLLGSIQELVDNFNMDIKVCIQQAT